MDFEILEGKSDWEKELPKNVKIGQTEVVVQQVIVNNQVQNITNKAPCLICPNCGQLIESFPPNTPEVEVLKALTTDDEVKLNKTMHCVKCGQKIKLMRPQAIDNQQEVTC